MATQKSWMGKSAKQILQTAKVERMNAGNIEVIVQVETPYGNEWIVSFYEWGISFHSSNYSVPFVLETTPRCAPIIQDLTEKCGIISKTA